MEVGAVMDKITFGKFIRENRKKAGLTQSDLAAMLEVNPNSIGNIERGQTFPDAEKLFRLISILNLSIDSLMFAECRLGQSLLPAELNAQIDTLTSDSRAIVIATIRTLIEQLSQREQISQAENKDK